MVMVMIKVPAIVAGGQSQSLLAHRRKTRLGCRRTLASIGFARQICWRHGVPTDANAIASCGGCLSWPHQVRVNKRPVIQIHAVSRSGSVIPLYTADNLSLYVQEHLCFSSFLVVVFHRSHCTHRRYARSIVTHRLLTKCSLHITCRTMLADHGRLRNSRRWCCVRLVRLPNIFLAWRIFMTLASSKGREKTQRHL